MGILKLWYESYFSIIIKSKIGGKSSKESKKGEKEIRRVITIKESTDSKNGSKERRRSKTLGELAMPSLDDPRPRVPGVQE